MLIKLSKVIIIASMMLPMFGCGHQYFPMPDDPRFAPVIPDIEAEPKPVGGSTYIDGYGLSLYQDMKAHRVGDIITVKLIEQTKANKGANVDYKKENTMSLGGAGASATNILGNNIKTKIPGILHSKSTNPLTLNNAVNSTSKFKGNGSADQANSLAGDITVTIAQVLPNKNLVIRGEKWLTLNQGAEYIRLTGIVRPEDIGPDNEVVSTRIANARITYSGTGPLADSNKEGWLARFFNSAAFPL